MSIYDDYKKRFRVSGHSGSMNPTIGQELKDMSDRIMEESWDSDVQSKVCYIYDYFHDDQPDKNRKITHSPDTPKTRIDAKFIVFQYSSLAKDQVEYHIQFKPSQKVFFDPEDDLYYYEQDFSERYGADFPIGLYIDIPDDQGVYYKWLICSKDIGNQFIKYSVLPCNYRLTWIEQQSNKRIKRKMWMVARQQLSYTNGVWTDYNFTTLNNVDRLIAPMNSITENLSYTHFNGDGSNQRVVVSAFTSRPLVWKITKVENTKPFGLQKYTLTQDSWNGHTDYIDMETREMYADYYSSTIPTVEAPILSPYDDQFTSGMIEGRILTNSTTIKAGGSFKKFSVVFSKGGIDFESADCLTVSNMTWEVTVSGATLPPSDVLVEQTDELSIRVKMVNKIDYIGENLVVSFSAIVNGQEVSSNCSVEILRI